MGKGRWHAEILLGLLAAAALAGLTVLLPGVFKPVKEVPVQPTVYPARVLGQHAPAEHGVLELVYRGAPGASAKIYWEHGMAEAMQFPATVDVPFGVLCVNAWKMGAGSYHEDVVIDANSPKKSLLITLHQSVQATAATLGFIQERPSRKDKRQPPFLETTYMDGDWAWGKPGPITHVSVDVAGQVWRGEERVGNVQQALLTQMLALRDAAALSPLSPGYTGCNDCGGKTLTLYRFSGDQGTTLAQWGGFVYHHISPEAQRLSEWGLELLALAWTSR